MLIFFLILIFIFGLFVGSFLNCVIWRLYQKKSFLIERSICPHCKHQLAWFDLIPIVSFVLLKGKCRYCHKPISWQYPLVELATAILFILPFVIQQFLPLPFYDEILWLEILYYLFLISVLIILFVYDLKHFIIPDKILIPALLITLFYFLIRDFYLFFLHSNFQIFTSFLYQFASATGVSGFFLLLYLISKGRWIGFGDVKLGFLLGFILSWPKSFVFMFLTYIIGGIIGIGLIIFKKKALKAQVPFAPFLIISFIISLFFGGEFINWYLNLLK